MSREVVGAILGLIFIGSFFVDPVAMYVMGGVNIAYIAFIAVLPR